MYQTAMLGCTVALEVYASTDPHVLGLQDVANFDLRVGDRLLCGVIRRAAPAPSVEVVFGSNRRLLCKFQLAPASPLFDSELYPSISVWGGASVELLPILPSFTMVRRCCVFITTSSDVVVTLVLFLCF